jgi:signal transduction histidine kinase
VRLSAQLLALARHESVNPENNGHFAVAESFSDIHAVYGAIAAEKGITLAPSAAPDAEIRGSAQQLILILGNLLDNALRYTKPGGTVELHGRVDAGSVHFEVRDAGAGLPEEELRRVFERFYRAPGDDTEGSGLGLATVATVVEHMGGRVWLENRRDRQGLVAHVTLPRSPDATLNAIKAIA